MSRISSTPSAGPRPLDVRLMNGMTLVLVLVLSMMVLTAVLGWLMRQPVFNLQVIRIETELGHNNAVTLRANVAPKLVGNFFTMDLARTRSAFESVPWVRQALVKREFPNALRVSMQEHEAVAFWGAPDESRLINTFGEVFEVNQGDVEANELPVLKGPQGQAALVLKAYRLLVPLFELLDGSLTQLELTGKGSWRARLESGATVEMGQGSPEEIKTRTERFVATVAQTSSKFGRNLESADLRYPNGYALRLRGVTTGGSGGKQDRKQG
jgi:cell division protein FtsQ